MYKQIKYEIIKNKNITKMPRKKFF